MGGVTRFLVNSAESPDILQLNVLFIVFVAFILSRFEEEIMTTLNPNPVIDLSPRFYFY